MRGEKKGVKEAFWKRGRRTLWKLEDAFVVASSSLGLVLLNEPLFIVYFLLLGDVELGFGW